MKLLDFTYLVPIVFLAVWAAMAYFSPARHKERQQVLAANASVRDRIRELRLEQAMIEADQSS